MAYLSSYLCGQFGQRLPLNIVWVISLLELRVMALPSIMSREMSLCHTLSQNIYTTYRCTHASCWPLFIFTPFEETSAFYPLFPLSTRHVAFVYFFLYYFFQFPTVVVYIFGTNFLSASYGEFLWQLREKQLSTPAKKKKKKIYGRNCWKNLDKKMRKYRLSPLVHTAWNNIFLPYH